MTREETKNIIRIMCDSYPNYKPNDLAETIEVWTMMLEEYTYEQISVALKAYILADTSGFAPSIGQLVAKVQTITQPQELNEMEAWGLVSKAIRHSAYRFAEEYAKLPPVVQKAVGVPEQLRLWAIDESYNEGVIMSQFQKCYRAEVAKLTEFRKMPSNIQRFIQNTVLSSCEALEQTKQCQTIKISSKDENALRNENNGVKTGIPDYVKVEFEKIRREVRKNS